MEKLLTTICQVRLPFFFITNPLFPQIHLCYKHCIRNNYFTQPEKCTNTRVEDQACSTFCWIGTIHSTYEKQIWHIIWCFLNFRLRLDCHNLHCHNFVICYVSWDKFFSKTTCFQLVWTSTELSFANVYDFKDDSKKIAKFFCLFSGFTN